MFEKEINFISDFSLNKVKKFGSFVTFEKILTTDIHPAIKQYISAELDYLIFQDRNKLLHESSFDYSGSELTKYFNLIGQEIKKSKRISFEDMRNLITQAVSFNINFLVRPKWALSNLIFDSSKEHTVQEVVKMLNYIHYYEYLRDILNEYLEKRKAIIINLTEFELIFNKLDRELFSTQTNSILENVLTSIAEFLNEGGINKNKISPSAIETFLKEKNLMDHLVTLRKTISADDRLKYDISDLKKILFAAPDLKEEKVVSANNDLEDHSLAEIEEEGENILAEIDDEGSKNSLTEFEGNTDSAEEQNINPTFHQEAESKITEEVADEKVTESEEDLLSFYESEIKALDEDGLFNGIDDEMPVVKQDSNDVYNKNENEFSTDKNSSEQTETVIQNNITSEISEQEKIEFEEEIFTFGNEHDKNVEEMVSQDEDIENLTSQTEPVELPQNEIKSRKSEKELFSFMSDKDMERIVGSVFNDDREDFATTIEKISECSNYNEATEILKGVYFSYKVSPFSKEAVTLTNIVSSYFHQS